MAKIMSNVLLTDWVLGEKERKALSSNVIMHW